MSKKKVALLIVILLILSSVFLMGASFTKFSFTLKDYDDNVVFSTQYTPNFYTRLEVRLKHRGDYYAYYKSTAKREKAPLSKLNKKLDKDISAALEGRYAPPTPARVEWDGKEFTYFDGEKGYYINRQKLYENIFKSYQKNFEVKLEKEIVKESPTKEELITATQKLSEFSTGYSSSGYARKNNIELAAKKIDGTVIASGETFSFNKIVGERTAENGFKESVIIQNGKFVKGIGGGVCQVSTTIYNAALLAGCEIVSVRQHSLPISYVPLSFDAMVSSGNDLVFKNISKYNLYISAKADGKRLAFVLYGMSIYPDCQIKLRSETIKVLHSNEYDLVPDSGALGEGESERVIKQAKSGYISEGYIDIYKGEKLVSSKQIRRDHYSPQKGVKIVKGADTAYIS